MKKHEYLKSKILLILKEELFHYSTEMQSFVDRENEYRNKVYENEKLSKCVTKDRWERINKEQIEWSREQYLANYNKKHAIMDIINKIENELEI